MKVRILNLTQHAATPEQVDAGVAEPKEKAAIRNALTFSKLPETSEIWDQAELLATYAEKELLPPPADWAEGTGYENWELPPHPTAMIGGAPYLMASLEACLLNRDIQPVYAFSLREVVEEPLPDGSVKKTMVFRHLGFVETEE